MNLLTVKKSGLNLSNLSDSDFKRLMRNHFDRKVNYLWIFLQIFFHRRAAIMDLPPRLVAACSRFDGVQRQVIASVRRHRHKGRRPCRFDGVQRQVIASATCLSSQPGVEVAPQMPTLSPSENQPGTNSDGSEIW